MTSSIQDQWINKCSIQYKTEQDAAFDRIVTTGISYQPSHANVFRGTLAYSS